MGEREAEEPSGGNLDLVGAIWGASGIWEASGKHLGGIWEASGKKSRASGQAMGLKEAIGSNFCNTSELKCKSSFKILILRGVFEGRCHQVM